MKMKRHKASPQKIEMEPVEVFARIKSLPSREESCINVVDETTLECVPPAAIGNDKGCRASFTRVFDENHPQSELFNCVAKPMVSKLLNGKNGLLFNYGVTSSGKTYTMTGPPSEPGFLPRSFEMIFASVYGKQTEQFQVQPDEQNGFKLLDEATFMNERVDRRHEISKVTLDAAPTYAIDEHYHESLKPGVKYAVFMSYIDIYNEQIYDLLDDSKSEKAVAKRIRDHREKGVYADGIRIVEIRSIEDAFKTYEKGLRQRRMAETNLNLTSSRSHCILTVHVVRVPYDEQSGEVFYDRNDPDLTKYTGSLNFVDLAGSERQNRTKAYGNRLKEAGNINNSLMTLRRCLESLRKNQRNNSNSEPVPYRSSKITHIFRNFFEVLGGIKLVICINPIAPEFEENLNVLKFAENAQNIQCRREVKDVDMANEIASKASERNKQKIRRKTLLEAWNVNEEALSLGPSIPCFELFDVNDDQILPNLINALRGQQERREVIEEECQRLSNNFRKKLKYFECEGIEALSRLQLIEPQFSRNEAELLQMQAEMKKLEKKNRALMETQRVYELDRNHLQSELHTKESELKLKEWSKKRVEEEGKRKLKDHERILLAETERKLSDTRNRAQKDLMSREKKLAQIRGILDSRQPGSAGRLAQTPLKSGRNGRRRSVSESAMEDSDSGTPRRRPPDKPSRRREPSPGSRPDTSHSRMASGSRQTTPARGTVTTSNTRGTTPSNSRGGSRPTTPGGSKRPLRSTDNMQKPKDKSDSKGWLAHTPNDMIQTNTVLQPSVAANKRVHIPTETDLKKSDRYLLTHQEENDQRQLKTTLVKGEIFDTKTGGIQVKFTGKEKLTTSNGNGTHVDSSRGKKRPSTENEPPDSIESGFTDVNVRCSTVVVHQKGADSAQVKSAKRQK